MLSSFHVLSIPLRSLGYGFRRFVSPRRLLALLLVLSFASTLPFLSHRLVRTCMTCMTWKAAALRTSTGTPNRSAEEDDLRRCIHTLWDILNRAVTPLPNPDAPVS